MKKIFIVILVLSLFYIGCASAPDRSYDSFSYRTSEFNESNLTVSGSGLTKEMINSILSTKFPPNGKISISIIFLDRNYRYSANSKLSYYIMEQGKNINKVEKFVPIPRIFVPERLTFDIIQNLGIRCLCEYTLLFYSNLNRTMNYSLFKQDEYKFESDIEFSLIDNQTTAIIASDRLYSSIIKKARTINDIDMEETENEIYLLQANLLAEKLNVLFKN